MTSQEGPHKKSLQWVKKMIAEEMLDENVKAALSKCPNCGFPVEESDGQCEACGWILGPKQGGEKDGIH